MLHVVGDLPEDNEEIVPNVVLFDGLAVATVSTDVTGCTRRAENSEQATGTEVMEAVTHALFVL